MVACPQCQDVARQFLSSTGILGHTDGVMLMLDGEIDNNIDITVKAQFASRRASEKEILSSMLTRITRKRSGDSPHRHFPRRNSPLLALFQRDNLLAHTGKSLVNISDYAISCGATSIFMIPQIAGVSLPPKRKSCSTR